MFNDELNPITDLAVQFTTLSHTRSSKLNKVNRILQSVEDPCFVFEPTCRQLHRIENQYAYVVITTYAICFSMALRDVKPLTDKQWKIAIDYLEEEPTDESIKRLKEILKEADELREES